jgi:CMP-N-acetylneuraminic acid synthetase
MGAGATRFLGIIPARGGSKGVPGKNIRPLAGKPLIAWTIAAARDSGVIDRLVVSTDDGAIAQVARDFGAEVRMRPAALAADDTPTRPVLEHVVGELEGEGEVFDAVVTLQPTSPLRRPRHVAEACAQFAADPQADSLVSCVTVPHIFNPVSVMKRDEAGYLVNFFVGDAIIRRQDKPEIFARNGAAVYVTRRNRIGDYVFGGRLLCYLMDERDSLDIDTLDDFAAAEAAMAARG